MTLADTHTHLYLDAFGGDRTESVKRSLEKGVLYQFLPNIDSSTTAALFRTCREFPGICFPMMGLHPTSVKENFAEELEIVEQNLEVHHFAGIGEIGIDLYWDQTFLKQQEAAFIHQLSLGKKYGLPVIIHSRNSIDLIMNILEQESGPSLSGILHCFPGNPEQARKAVSMGFLLGIGGVVTYPKSGMAEVVRQTGLQHIVLETDAPYLPPVPFRGKRNESAFIPYIAQGIAYLKGISVEEVAETTTANALKVFRI